MTWWRGVLAVWMLVSVCWAKARYQDVKREELLKIFQSELDADEANTNTRQGDFSKDELNELEGILKRILNEKENSHGLDYSSEEAAKKWLATYNEDLAKQITLETEANWNHLTNITKANEDKVTQASVVYDKWLRTQFPHAKAFSKHADSFTDPDVKSMLEKIRFDRLVPFSDDPTISRTQSELEVRMQSIYASAKVQSHDGRRNLTLDPDLEELMANSRDYETLAWVWKAWRDAVGPNVKPLFVRLVENMNKAAVENGMHDVGEAWRMADFMDDDIEDVVVDLWAEVQPLYQSLHAYVRRKLVAAYPEMKGQEKQAMPAHLFGNMWAQNWVNILDLVVPYPGARQFNITSALADQHYTPVRIFHLADAFFTSLGLAPMTDTFWEKSLIKRPADGRDVDCHGAADDFMRKPEDGDFRIKMCTKVNGDSFETVHHEMGHIQYFMEYAVQPTLYRNGANAAFHEAIGDTIALSVNTPKHLATVHLLKQTHKQSKKDEEESDLNYLMLQALKKIVFLPFGYLIDKWRWDVFSGKVAPDKYNEHWWKLRLELQGMKPPVERSENDFDPGAKFHVPSNVPYLRYFLSHIAQFQFYKSMCEASGHEGELHKCDFYGSKAAGKKLSDTLSLGSSKPWPDAMEVMTGQKQFQAGPLLEYFLPLTTWLEKQNEGEYVGWEEE